MNAVESSKEVKEVREERTDRIATGWNDGGCTRPDPYVRLAVTGAARTHQRQEEEEEEPTMTKKMTDEELAKISGAGDEDKKKPADLKPELDTGDQSGPGGPGSNVPDSDAPGGSVGDLSEH
jgi:hypothetical protein